MGFFDKLADVATGGLAKQVIDAVQAYFPPDMNPEQKAQLQIQLMQIESQRIEAANKAIAESEQAINDRIAIYEGTASDLKSIPILGPMMLFLRGAQRPIIGYGTIYLDWQVFSGLWPLTERTIISAFWVINLLVLGFLFGERAVQNLAPLITDFMKAKTGS